MVSSLLTGMVSATVTEALKLAFEYKDSSCCRALCNLIFCVWFNDISIPLISVSIPLINRVRGSPPLLFPGKRVALKDDGRVTARVACCSLCFLEEMLVLSRYNRKCWCLLIPSEVKATLRRTLSGSPPMGEGCVSECYLWRGEGWRGGEL